jgi:hypothetical protein
VGERSKGVSQVKDQPKEREGKTQSYPEQENEDFPDAIGVKFAGTGVSHRDCVRCCHVRCIGYNIGLFRHDVLLAATLASGNLAGFQEFYGHFVTAVFANESQRQLNLLKKPNIDGDRLQDVYFLSGRDITPASFFSLDIF